MVSKTLYESEDYLNHFLIIRIKQPNIILIEARLKIIINILFSTTQKINTRTKCLYKADRELLTVTKEKNKITNKKSTLLV